MGLLTNMALPLILGPAAGALSGLGSGLGAGLGQMIPGLSMHKFSQRGALPFDINELAGIKTPNINPILRGPSWRNQG
jgi:hypothetical protein